MDVAAESFPGIDRIAREWESLLGYLADQNAVIVLDEFPYLIDADESLPSVLQRLWDQELRETSVTLILVGSSISMMEEATLLGNSPLYGRFTEKIDLRQLDFAAVRTFLPENYSPEQLLLAWGVFGGTPRRYDEGGNEVDLTVVRDSGDGAFEDSYRLESLSDSERSLVGICVALAAYQVHDSAEEAPMVLLDSVEEFDSERVRRLVEYVADEVPRVVVALLPEDASEVSADMEVSADALA